SGLPGCAARADARAANDGGGGGGAVLATTRRSTSACGGRFAAAAAAPAATAPAARTLACVGVTATTFETGSRVTTSRGTATTCLATGWPLVKALVGPAVTAPGASR